MYRAVQATLDPAREEEGIPDLLRAWRYYVTLCECYAEDLPGEGAVNITSFNGAHKGVTSLSWRYA